MLYYGTQVPSASIFSEEVRFNTERICGRANKVLSEMVIGSPKASTIDKKNKGHFFTSWDTDFRGYLFFESLAFKNCSKKKEKNSNECTSNN